MLSDRELASLAWVGMVAVGALVWTPLRPLLRLVGVLLRPVFLIPVGFFAAYVAAVVALASRTSAWNVDLIKDTVVSRHRRRHPPL